MSARERLGERERGAARLEITHRTADDPLRCNPVSGSYLGRHRIKRQYTVVGREKDSNKAVLLAA